MEDIKARRELVCKSCNKSRFLSLEEAEEDGWKFDTKSGLLCDKCLPKYGISATFLRSPSYAGLCESRDGKVGIEILF